jgi:hypothetical protein
MAQLGSGAQAVPQDWTKHRPGHARRSPANEMRHMTSADAAYHRQPAEEFAGNRLGLPREGAQTDERAVDRARPPGSSTRPVLTSGCLTIAPTLRDFAIYVEG